MQVQTRKHTEQVRETPHKEKQGRTTPQTSHTDKICFISGNKGLNQNIVIHI